MNTSDTMPADDTPVTRYRAIWISDLHLGQRECKAERLLDFIKHHDADNWYLVGDVFDGQALQKSFNWPQSHNTLVQKMLRKVRKGARVVCIPGNHDDFLLGFARHAFGVILVLPDTMHETADHRRLWVVHGDRADDRVQFGPGLKAGGNGKRHLMAPVGRLLNILRRKLGLAEWSLAAYVKSQAADAGRTIESFENTMVRMTRRNGADGVVCGHIHQAGIKEINGLLYCNTGDWVESCTALAEHADGRLELIRWDKTAGPI